MPGSIRAMVVMVGWEWGYTAFSVLWAVTTVNYGGKRGELGSCPLPHCDQPSSLAVGGISFTFFVPKFQPKTFFSPKLFIWFLGGRFTYVYVHTHTSCLYLCRSVDPAGTPRHPHRLQTDTEGCQMAILKTSPRYLIREKYFGTSVKSLSGRFLWCYLSYLISCSLFINYLSINNTCPFYSLWDFWKGNTHKITQYYKKHLKVRI